MQVGHRVDPAVRSAIHRGQPDVEQEGGKDGRTGSRFSFLSSRLPVDSFRGGASDGTRCVPSPPRWESNEAVKNEHTSASRTPALTPPESHVYLRGLARVSIKTAREIEQMRKSCQLAARVLEFIGPKIRPGVTTGQLDRLCHDFIVGHGAYPSPLNYRPKFSDQRYPKSICASVNEVVCHGIPNGRVLENGDIVNLDITTYLGGFHGDTNATFFVGSPRAEAKRVVEVARKCLDVGIAQVRPGARLGDIGAAIQEYAEGHRCSVVREFTGHGIGREFHEDPHVPHFGVRGKGLRLQPGMTFTIEPMINGGDYAVEMLDDGWTVLTRDRSLSAQFEHTLLVTTSSVDVMTTRQCPLVNSEVGASE
ncbi:MAG: type I methionyl aminopeptidase [Deltaproteobacteria bacterium]|nr:type I methionyl aminopeptidase [Deltaproteobacteria bacterium]